VALNGVRNGEAGLMTIISRSPQHVAQRRDTMVEDAIGERVSATARQRSRARPSSARAQLEQMRHERPSASSSLFCSWLSGLAHQCCAGE